jgi:hypothetical protein
MESRNKLVCFNLNFVQTQLLTAFKEVQDKHQQGFTLIINLITYNKLIKQFVKLISLEEHRGST